MDKTSFSRETIITVRELKALSRDFGLPCIEERDGVTLSVVGEKQLLIFNILEEKQCQLIEIY